VKGFINDATGELLELICANTPPAKGRVERAHATLPDRLVKERRLRGISDMATANTHLPAFRLDFNRRFAVTPHHPHAAHRRLRPADDLTRILAIREVRTLSKNLTLPYNGVWLFNRTHLRSL
jgi:hypothetical protein